jgi:hypothetical protein
MKKARKIKRKSSKRMRKIATRKPFYVTNLENQIASLSARVEQMERVVPRAEAFDAIRRALRTLAAIALAGAGPDAKRLATW